MKNNLFTLSLLSAGLLLSACSDSDDGPAPIEQPDGPVLDVPSTYAFQNKTTGDNSVSYSGQTMRHVLIDDLNTFIASKLQTRIDNGDFAGVAKDDIVKTFTFYFDFDDAVGANAAPLLNEKLDLFQTTYSAISSGKNLVGKIAGRDEVGQHKDWTTEFRGTATATTPENYVRSLFDELADNVVLAAQGTLRNNEATGNAVGSIYETTDGRDLKQLIQKFLLGSVAFSQAADDYLDNDTEDKGLLSSNVLAEGETYTDLEHVWDEAFGYFGAARNFNDYTDEEVAGKGGRETHQGYNDVNTDGLIDVYSEYNFGNSVNTAKRDLGSTDGAKTDFSANAFTAFLTGRAIIANADGELSTEQMEQLIAQRDRALENWEKAIAATVVHYINDMTDDINSLTDETSTLSDADIIALYSDYAKHFSEMKGFALGLQFNPHSFVSDEDFVEFHRLVGNAPLLPTGATAEAIATYKNDLITARTLLANAYEFATANVENW